MDEKTIKTLYRTLVSIEWWDILHTVIPNFDRTSSPFPNLRRFEAEVNDHENLTLFTPRPGFTINDTLKLIPGNSTTLKFGKIQTYKSLPSNTKLC